MLTLEIEYLTGVCFAARSEGNPTEEPDWPPQPDRVFSALVAAWGTRGEHREERAALEWLEQQAPPVIQASEAGSRHVGISYVPPNDATRKAEAIPERRSRQARMFPAALPHRPLVRVNWATQPEQDRFEALQALAKDAAYLGHSASLVRCRFLLESTPDSSLPQMPARRRVYQGRLASLERSYHAGERPLPGGLVAIPPSAQERPVSTSLFDRDWIIFEDAGGRCPDLRAIAAVARRMRDALMSRYGAAGLPVPELISGHQPDGSPSVRPHLAIVPLADVDFLHSEGRLMGLGLILPAEAGERRRNAERAWLAGLEESAGETEQWQTLEKALSEITQLELGALGVWKLNWIIETSRKSLQPGRYVRAYRRWSSVTPIALDRFPRNKTSTERDEEMAEIISSSCVNIGLPKPSQVRIFKHAAVRSAPSAYPSGKAPAWTGWNVPGFLANRMLTHATIDFSEPVRGPVILGGGRFMGLGLCLGQQE